jgi:tetratricopeptide (TPR) repeat protein
VTVFYISQKMANAEKGFPHMNLADERLKALDNPSLTPHQRALLRCEVAADLIHRGQYESAREALGDLWRGVGVRPNVEGLEELTVAEVLRLCGALSGWIGASKQEKAQEVAKDLLSESAALFERLGEVPRAAIARSDLALCYWREGAYDEARVLLIKAFDVLYEKEQKAKVLLRRTTVEYSAHRYNDVLSLLKSYEQLFDESVSHVLRGSFQNHLALVLRRLGTVEGHVDYFDRAILAYTAAIYHYEQARHERYAANNESNLAFLLYKLGRYKEAHQHLDRARRVLLRLKDAGLLAEAEETKARVLIAEQKYREANGVIAGVVQTFEKGGSSALLADALTVQGIVWARLGIYESSINVIRRAISIGEQSGALSNAGMAALTLIEEHGAKRLSDTEIYKAYRQADYLLKGTQDNEDMERLRACARIVTAKLSGEYPDKNFSLPKAVLAYEARYIERALESEQGSVTRAAKRLGIGHQSLSNMLKTRHRRLLNMRTPPKRRGRNIFKKKT